MPQIGCAAWSNWTYALTVNGQIISSDLNQTQIVQEVDDDNEIEIEIQAKSSGGIGPKSEVMKVKSWPKLFSSPMLYLMTVHQVEVIYV